MVDPLYQRACQLIDSSGLVRVAPYLKGHLKYAIHLASSPAPDQSFILGASRLGGTPDMPEGLTWPTWQQVPMAFLAQINLVEVAPYDLEQFLPSQGWLYFFCQSQGFIQGIDFNVHEYVDPLEPGGWKVFFFEGTEADLRQAQAPVGLSQAGKFHPCVLQFHLEWDLPPYESLFIEPLHLSDQEQEQYFDLLDTFEEVFWNDGIRYHHHRLLGYPNQIQGDEQLICQLASTNVPFRTWDHLDENARAPIKASALEWTHLLQIETDRYAHMSWRKQGSLSYWIRRTDLKKHNFADCWARDDSL